MLILILTCEGEKQQIQLNSLVLACDCKRLFVVKGFRQGVNTTHVKHFIM
jgi:hypothetical protein